MASIPVIQYFLGANAPGGFYSLYSELISPETARAIYILKGGPGCGKSTLMRRVGARMEEAGAETEYIPCSGDPASLDALVLPRLGVALVDGTAPHGTAPLGHFSGTSIKFYGVTAQKITVSNFWWRSDKMTRLLNECKMSSKNQFYLTPGKFQEYSMYHSPFRGGTCYDRQPCCKSGPRPVPGK